MFGWVKKFFGKQVVSASAMTDGIRTFKPREMLIYEYWNGKEVVRADPLTLYKKVLEQGQDLSTHLKVANMPGYSKAPEGETNAVNCIRSIFNIPSFEQGGLLEGHCLELLDHFMIFCHTVKKNSSQTPTLPEETSPSIKSTSKGESPT